MKSQAQCPHKEGAFDLVKPSKKIVPNKSIMVVLSEKFPNGFRTDSEIEINHFRRCATDIIGVELNISDDELIKTITSVGTQLDNRVYSVSEETKNTIKTMVEEYFLNGAEAIFYDAFFEREKNWLASEHIVLPRLLKEIILSTIPEMLFTETFFGFSDDPISLTVEKEVLRVWGNNVLQSYEELSEKLLYTPTFRIKQMLGQHNDFIRNSAGVYTHITKVLIPETDREEIVAAVERGISAHNFVTVSDLPLGNIIELNSELSKMAVRDAVFRACLMEYNLRGSVISRKYAEVDAYILTEEYCTERNKCTLNELSDYWKEITGTKGYQSPMEVAYRVMVRVDEKNFVAEEYVDFDVQSIDNTIESMLNGREYLPLKSVTTFALFPHCEQNWNLFLLESFVFRFSKKFRFNVLSPNSQNIGAIVRKQCHLDYHDIMVDAVLKADVELEKEAVLNYLCENGYLGRRRYTKVDDIINAVSKKRGR